MQTEDSSIQTWKRWLLGDLREAAWTARAYAICLPPNSVVATYIALMTMEDGALGVAIPEGGRLISLWSMETRSNGDIGWAQIRVIELEKLLSVKALPISSSSSIVFAPGTGVLFVHGDDRLFTIGLKSDQVRKVLDNDKYHIVSIVPYMSFYTPGTTLLGFMVCQF